MIVDSDRPAGAGGKAFHIGVRPDQVAPWVLLPGDPKRCALIASTWDDARLMGDHREHVTYTGHYKGLPVTCCSTGVGGPSAANALEELAMCGAHTFIRVGTTGALQRDTPCGSLIVNSGAVRHDGTSDLYVEPAYPAFAHHQCVAALLAAAAAAHVPAQAGVCCSTSSFYAGQGRPGLKSLVPAGAVPVDEVMAALGVLNFEMEAATLFVLGSLYKLRVGAVCAVIANRVTKELRETGIEQAVAVANEALLALARLDGVIK